MRSNRGITLTSLIIYIIIFTIVIATVSTMSGYFNKNMDDVVISANSSEQYNRLLTYLTEDLNSINFKDITVQEDYIDIKFLDESTHTYIYDDNKIYYISEKNGNIEKRVTLCSSIENFTYEYDNNTKKLKISVTIEGITYNNNYSL